MKWRLAAIVLACIGHVGCGDTVKKETDTAPSTATPNPAAAGGTAGDSSAEAAFPPAQPKPVAIDSGAVALVPESTKIEFVGLHKPPKKPDPRLGGFAKFSGKAEVDGKTLKSVAIAIETGSLWSQFPQLTSHLSSGDFFEVKEHPTASFTSTSITADEAAAGKYTVSGDLTLHGVTKPIQFPATVSVTDEGLTLVSRFEIDRTEFGMTFGRDQVEEEVALNIVIGQKTEPKTAGGPPGGG